METQRERDSESWVPAAKVLTAGIAEDLAAGRRRTLGLIEPVPEDALGRQVCSYLSPLVWDLGHIAAFERLWLVDAVEGLSGRRLEERFDALDTPREKRGALSLPKKAEVYRELSSVRRESLALLDNLDPASRDPLLRDGYVYRMVMQHEAQHQETMLQALDLPEAGWGWSATTDGDHRAGGAFRNERTGAIHGASAYGVGGVAADDELMRVSIAAGPFMMGTADRSRAYDNERPLHEVDVREFEMERYPVTNRRWLGFIADDGYRRGDLWSAGGRAWLAAHDGMHPQGWSAGSVDLNVRRFGNELPLDPAEPVQHVCYWEAEAFARWSGGRLPSEAEWEKAAAWGPDTTRPRTYPWGEEPPGGLGAAGGADAPAVVSASAPPRIGTHPERASAWGVQDMLGAVYQWTSSRFEGYPGFESFPYREYSAAFFGRDYAVLRGSSWAAAPILWRNTYRNWDLPQRRQIFAGVRVVYGD